MPRHRTIAAIALIALGFVIAAQAAPGQRAQLANSVEGSPAQGAIPARISCVDLVQDGAHRNPAVPDFENIPDAPTRVTSAKIVAALNSQPEYCEVNGYVQSQIKFQLKLPTSTWHGRYLQVGCGGYCGVINQTPFPACSVGLGDFAMAATNDAHDTPQGYDALWAGNDEQARIDYGYRGVHVVALAAKAIQEAYYGRPPAHSYWIGCSDGGREGLIEAQRYPRDFDGIIAGAPASMQTFNPLTAAWGIRTNSDANDNPILTSDKLAMLHAAVVKACDANDGVPGDGLIGDSRDCTFEPASIQCKSVDAPDCLTAPQVRVVETFYKGNFDSEGRWLDPRTLPRGSELSWASGFLARPRRGMQQPSTICGHMLWETMPHAGSAFPSARASRLSRSSSRWMNSSGWRSQQNTMSR